MIIYLTTNKINSIIYIGRYCGNSNSYIGSGTRFKQAVKKYGKENFSREILEDNIEDYNYLCEREIYWIRKYDSTNPKIGYNIAIGGGSPMYGRRHSEEARAKMSFAKIGKPLSEKIKAKMSVSHLGKHHSQKTKNKISKINKGRHFSEKHKAKISAALIGRYSGENSSLFGRHSSKETKAKISKNHIDVSGENNPMSKLEKTDAIKILGLFYNNGFTSREISKKYDVSYSAIRNIVTGRTWKNTYKKFILTRKK